MTTIIAYKPSPTSIVMASDGRITNQDGIVITDDYIKVFKFYAPTDDHQDRIMIGDLDGQYTGDGQEILIGLTGEVRVIELIKYTPLPWWVFATGANVISDYYSNFLPELIHAVEQARRNFTLTEKEHPMDLGVELLIGVNGNIYRINRFTGTLYDHTELGYCATGTGRDFAYGVMYMKNKSGWENPNEIFDAVFQNDNQSGGKVLFHSIGNLTTNIPKSLLEIE